MAGSPAGGGMINPAVYPGILQGGPEVRRSPALQYKFDREFQFQGLHHMAAAGFGADLGGGYNPNLVRFSLLQSLPFRLPSCAFCCGALRFAASLLRCLVLLFDCLTGLTVAFVLTGIGA